MPGYVKVYSNYDADTHVITQNLHKARELYGGMP